MGNLVVGGILLIVLGAAIAYIVKAKKSGVKCIGCSAGGSCSGHCGCGSDCSCHTDKK